MSSRAPRCPGCTSPRSSPTKRPGAGFRRLGLTGTRWLVESEVYPEKLTARGLAYLRPNTAERDEIQRIIMDELVLRRLQTRGGRLLPAGDPAR